MSILFSVRRDGIYDVQSGEQALDPCYVGTLIIRIRIYIEPFIEITQSATHM